MSALAKISRIIDKINSYIGNLCAIFAFSMVIVVFTVVVLRYGFNIGFIWMQEVYVWLHSFVFMLGAGFTYLANEHVRIDVFYRDASKKYKATVDLLSQARMILPLLFLSGTSTTLGSELTRNTPRLIRFRLVEFLVSWLGTSDCAAKSVSM